MNRSDVREVSRGSFYLGLEQLTMIIGGVLYSIIVLRMLGPATYGVLNLGQAAIGIASILTTNIETYLERFTAELAARGKGHVLRRLAGKIGLIKVSLALVAMVLVIILADLVARAYGYRDLRRLLPVLSPLILLEGAYLVLRVTLFGLQRFRSIWVVAVGNNLLKLAVVFALWRLHEGVVALVAGIVLVQAVTVAALAILVLRFLPKGSTASGEVPTYRRIWDYVLPLLGARMFFLSGQHLNRLILGALLPARELGLAAFALMTIERFIALAGAVPNSLLPTLARLRGEERSDRIEQVITQGYRLVTALAVFLMAGTFCLAREAVLITGGAEYTGATLPLQILALVPLFRTIQQPLNMSFYTYEKTRTVFWLAAIKFAVEPLAYPLLIPRFGIAGVALASLISSVVVFAPTSRVANHLFPGTVGVRRRVTWIAWTIGLVVVVAGVSLRRVGEPWPGLALRLAVLLGALALILLVGKIVRGDDLRRLAESTGRERTARMLGRAAGWLDRVQAGMVTGS